MKKAIIIVAVMLIAVAGQGFAGDGFYFKETLRYGMRRKSTVRISRLGTEVEKKIREYNFRIEPFWENRWGLLEFSSDEGAGRTYLEKNTRQELGFEIGMDILKWFYWGESFQYIRERPGPDGTEMETRLVFKKELSRARPVTHTLLKEGSNGVKVKPVLYFFEEYYYNIARGEAVNNEIGLGLFIPVDKHAININWRHIDPIHHLDEDTIEVSVIIRF